LSCLVFDAMNLTQKTQRCILHLCFGLHRYACTEEGDVKTRFPFRLTPSPRTFAEIVMAIDGLHERGIVHRDLKPENVLINSRGHLVITDFGASKMKLEDEADIRTNSWVGTELFMAPETLQGKVYGRVVDWWAVGVLAWEMFTGDNPFYHENPEQIAIKVQKKKLLMPTFLGPSTHSLIKGLLTRDPEKRLGKGGAKEVKDHAFFSKCKGFSWKSAWNKEVFTPCPRYPTLHSKTHVICQDLTRA
jgi:serine/threonine protein kinase